MSDSSPIENKRIKSRLIHVARRLTPLVILLFVLAGAYFYWGYWDPSPKHEAPTQQMPTLTVETIAVEKEDVPIRMRFLGQTEAALFVEIRARVAGYLEERSFKEGERVETGQRLFQIDPRPFEVQVAQARAGLASAEAQLERATQQLERFERLTVQGAVTEGEIDDWRTQQRVAVAAVQESRAQIDAAELQLQYATIESPITGMIGQALKDIGSYVDAGQNGLLAVVQQVDPIYVRYSVTEQDVLRFQRQLAADEIVAPEIDKLELEIELSDGSIYPHRGHINFVDVQVDETTGTSVIRGQVANPDGNLKPGQFIYATVLGIQRVNAIRVPQEAVLQSPGGASVMIVNDNSKAESQPVTLGDWSGGDTWIIEKGLEPGDRVIVSQLMRLRPGMPVTLSDAAPPSAVKNRETSAATTSANTTGEPAP